MWLLPWAPSFHAAKRSWPSHASVGNSRLRMYCPGASFRTPRPNEVWGTEGVTFAIFTPGPNDWPPSSERKIHSLNLGGGEGNTQSGLFVSILSAATYSLPFAGSTIGWAPMYWWKEQFSKVLVNLSA